VSRAGTVADLNLVSREAARCPRWPYLFGADRPCEPLPVAFQNVLPIVADHELAAAAETVNFLRLTPDPLPPAERKITRTRTTQTVSDSACRVRAVTASCHTDQRV
jgi:hypothetical protein